MPLINQQRVIDGVESATVSIHEQKIDHITLAQFAPSVTEILVDFRPVEFSEKNPPKPQLAADELLALATRLGDKKLGIVLSGASDYQFLAADFAKVLPLLSVIVIDFHGFRDGRGYSLAQAIRQHPNFSQNITLRASGDIIPDTLQLLTEVGFGEFYIADDDFSDAWFGYFDDIKHTYTGRSVHELPMFAGE